MISDDDIRILEEIVEKEGKCMSSTRCQRCPFRAMCLPEFLYPNKPTSNQRFNMAMDILVHNSLIDSNYSVEDFKKAFRGIRKQ